MATDVVGHFKLGIDALDEAHTLSQTKEAKRRPLAYSMIAVLLPLVAIPAFILLGSSDFFLNHGASVWVQSNDAIFQMQGRHCDVLIYGDSTAMTGIDPSLVEKDTGLHTCNIAVTNAVLNVTNNLTLDRYLAQNSHPKVLLVQLSPDGFQRDSRIWKNSIYAEGMLEMLRHGTHQEARHMLMQHPQEAIAFAGYAAGFTAYYGLKQALYLMTGTRPEEDDVRVHNGFFTPPAPARTQCEAMPQAILSGTAQSFASHVASQYRTTYGQSKSLVLINVAPIPSCDNNLQMYQKELAGVTNNRLLALPIGYFNDNRHYTASGSEVVSRMISDEVNQSVGLSLEETQRRHGSMTYASIPFSAPIVR